MTLNELIADYEKHELYSKAMFENNKHLFNPREKDYLKSVHRIHVRILEDLKKLTIPRVINWVSIKDGIPPEKHDVLTWDGYMLIYKNWEKYTGSDDVWFKKTVTHWTYDVKPPLNNNNLK